MASIILSGARSCAPIALLARTATGYCHVHPVRSLGGFSVWHSVKNEATESLLTSANELTRLLTPGEVCNVLRRF